MTYTPTPAQASTAALAKAGIIPAGWGPDFKGHIYITFDALIEAMDAYADYRGRVILGDGSTFTHKQDDQGSN